jgi:hypothetical protein
MVSLFMKFDAKVCTNASRAFWSRIGNETEEKKVATIEKLRSVRLLSYSLASLQLANQETLIIRNRRIRGSFWLMFLPHLRE